MSIDFGPLTTRETSIPVDVTEPGNWGGDSRGSSFECFTDHNRNKYSINMYFGIVIYLQLLERVLVLYMIVCMPVGYMSFYSRKNESEWCSMHNLHFQFYSSCHLKYPYRNSESEFASLISEVRQNSWVCGGKVWVSFCDSGVCQTFIMSQAIIACGVL